MEIALPPECLHDNMENLSLDQVKEIVKDENVKVDDLALYAAVLFDDKEDIAEFLLDKMIERGVPVFNNSKIEVSDAILLEAVDKNYLNLVKRLIRQDGVDLSYVSFVNNNNNALEIAINNNSQEMVVELINAHAVLNVDFTRNLQTYLDSIPQEKRIGEEVRLKGINNLAANLRENHSFDDEEILDLDLPGADLEEVEAAFAEYPNLPKLLKFANQRFKQGDRYRLDNVGEFLALAEGCEGFRERINSAEMLKLAFFADFVVNYYYRGSELGASYDILELDYDVSDGELEVVEEKSDKKEELEVAAEKIRKKEVGNICAKRKCAANEPPRKTDGFKFLIPSEAVEKPYFDSFNSKVEGELKKDALSQHTNKIAIKERNLGTYWRREAGMAVNGGVGRR